MSAFIPNPVNKDSKLELELLQSMRLELHLLDIRGKRLQSWNYPMLGQGTHEIPFLQETFHALPAGIYMLQIQTGYGSGMKKIVKP